MICTRGVSPTFSRDPRDAVNRATELCRNGEGPVIIEASTYRYYGHSLSDPRNEYRTKEEEEAWKAVDPIESLGRQLIENGILDDEGLGEVKAKQQALKARHESASSSVRVRRTVYDGRVEEAFKRFEQMERRLDHAEGEVESMDLGRGKTLAEEIADLEAETAIEEELEQQVQALEMFNAHAQEREDLQAEIFATFGTEVCALREQHRLEFREMLDPDQQALHDEMQQNRANRTNRNGGGFGRFECPNTDDTDG